MRNNADEWSINTGQPQSSRTERPKTHRHQKRVKSTHDG